MRTRTLVQLIADVRQRADLVSSQFVTDLEITEYLNQSATDLYDLKVAARGQDYYEATYAITTVAGTPTYALPPDFYQMITVETDVGGFKVVMVPFMRTEHGKYSFLPLSGGRSITLYYVPACPRLVSSGDTFDGVNGWEELIVVDAAMKCLEKEESDVSALMARKAMLTERIQAMAPERDAGMPERVQAIRNRRNTFATAPVPYYRMRGDTIEFVEGALTGLGW